ncbi:hypothetical protein [Streptomyces sp. MMBL 11-3]|uniref:hypothetical protein n=1 Tax=Streptomyces sp. MMBL 11-3 TaxID=3382639 RepID=UPI0039B4E6DE
MSDSWFRREAAAAVPRQRADEPDATRLQTGRIVWGTTGATAAVDTTGPAAAGAAAFDTHDTAFDATQGYGNAAGPTTGRDLGHAAGPDASRAAGYDAPRAAGHDSWQESEHPEHTHDPHEVTVQLDGVGRQMEDWLVQQAKRAPGAQDAADGPVFVDETGRRSRLYRRIGMAVGLACAVYAVVILVTVVSGNSNAPWLPLQDQQQDSPAGKVETTPLPADSAAPSDPASASPEASASGDEDVAPAPDAGLSADPSASATAPQNSADPEPSATRTKPGTGTGTDNNNTPDPGPTKEVPASPDPDPEPTDTGVTDGPTTEAPAGSDTNDVAADPITGEPTPLEPSPPISSSPENIL